MSVYTLINSTMDSKVVFHRVTPTEVEVTYNNKDLSESPFISNNGVIVLLPRNPYLFQISSARYIWEALVKYEGYQRETFS